MARYPLGGPVRVSVTVRDAAGTLVDPDTLTLAVLTPDGTTETYSSPATSGTGLYYQDVPAADVPDVGRYAYTWTATGPGAGVVAGSFDAFDPLAPAILTLEDAKAHLNKTSTTDDAELAYFVAATEAVITRLAGAVVPRTVTEVVRQRGGSCSLMLATRPVVSVTSLTGIRDGAVYDVAALYVANALAGIVRRTDEGAISGGPWTAVYRAGRSEVPANIGLAARVLVQHLWETQRGGPVNVPRLDTSMQEGFPGVWFAVPNRVKELCEGESVSLMAY